MTIKIPGIDEEKGLSLYGDDYDIYLPVLRSYAVNMPAVIDNLSEVTEQNLPLYAINVHGLKGASGSIGATDVKERAARMEAMAKEGDLSGVVAENEILLDDARKLETNIQSWLTKYDAAGSKPHMQAPDPQLLIDLQKYSEQFDMNGVDTIMDELENNFYNTDNDLILWLREKVDISDFTSISTRLKMRSRST